MAPTVDRDFGRAGMNGAEDSQGLETGENLNDLLKKAGLESIDEATAGKFDAYLALLLLAVCCVLLLCDLMFALRGDWTVCSKVFNSATHC